MRNMIAMAAILMAAATAQAEDILATSPLKVVPADKEVVAQPAFKDCTVFKRPDGRTFRTIDNEPVQAGGTCPPGYIKGKLIKGNELEIEAHGVTVESSHRVCVLNGNGSCMALRLLQHPTVPSTTVLSLLYPSESEGDGVVMKEEEGPKHVLRVGKPSVLASMYPGEWSTCRTLYAPDGTAYVSRGKLMAVSGNCPPHRFVPAKLIGTDELLVGREMCKLNSEGRCVATKLAKEPLPAQMPGAPAPKW